MTDNGCDYVISKPFISPKHCLFTYKDGEFIVQDLGSKNGTFINGERITRGREVMAPIGSEVEVTKNVVLELFQKPEEKFDLFRLEQLPDLKLD